MQGRRPRNNRPHSNNGARRENNNRMQVFDSNGPDVRIRGTAHQVCEKYVVLARDASSAGDSVLAESYLQYAEHYQRIINSWQQENPVREHATDSAPSYPSEAPQPYAQPNGRNAEEKDGNVEEDLSLPISILGKKPDVSHEERYDDSDKDSKDDVRFSGAARTYETA